MKSSSHTYKRILVILLISFEATLIIFAGVFFSSLARTSMEEIELMNRRVVEKLSKNIQFMNEIVNKYCMLLFNDNQINFLFYGNEESDDYFEEINVINHLHNMSEAYGMVHSVVIYNGVADRFYSWDSSYCTDELVRQIHNGAEIKTPIWRVLPKSAYYTETSVLTYVMQDPQNTDGFVLVNATPSWLEDDMKNESSDNLRLMVVDIDGNVVVQSKNASAERRLPKQLADKLEGDNGSVKYEDDNGKTAVATYHKITESDWFFVSINSYKNMYGVIEKMEYLALGLTVLFGVFGFIIVLLVGRSIYNPIVTLVARAENIFGVKKREKDELEYLHEILEYSSQLKTVDCQMVLKEIFVNGESPDYNIRNCLALSDTLKNAQKIVLVYIKSVSTELIKNMLEGIRCEIVTIRRGDVLMVVADAEDSGLLDESCCRMTEKCDSVIICRSEELDIGDNLNECYRRLESNSAYRLIFGDRCIITQQNIEGNMRNAEQLIYPADVSARLSERMEKDDAEGAMEVFAEFLDKISENSVDNYLIALTKLVMLLFSNEKGEFSERIGSYSQKIIGADSKNEILGIFRELFGEIERQHENSSKTELATVPRTKTEVIVDAIKMVVDNSYYNSSLCVASIANELKLSPGYIGRLFIQSTGISVSEYINRLRIEEAVRILSGTDYNIKKVMELVGYDNESTFYKKFKKYTGMTPKEFRLINSDSDYAMFNIQQ